MGKASIYEIRELDRRLPVLLQRVKDGAFAGAPHERRRIYDAVFARLPDECAAVKIAVGFSEFLAQKTLTLLPCDFFAGNLQFYDYSTSMPLLPPQAAPEADSRYLLSDDRVRCGWDLHREIDHCRRTHPIMETAPEEGAAVLEAIREGHRCGLYARWASGHVIPGFEKVLRMGWKQIETEAQAALENAAPELRGNIQAMLLCAQAARRYLRRWSALASAQAQTADNPQEQQAMERIAAACAVLAENPPRTFFEAVQSVIITQDLIISESASGSLSLGRLDQYLFPYYTRDRALGLLDDEEAQTLIVALWLKLGNLSRGFQNVTLGGCDKEGRCAVNPLTVFALRASGYTHLDQPLLSFRYHPDTAPETWDEIFRLLSTGLGFPALFNDDIVLQAKASTGVAQEDLWRYGIVGCVEPSIPGDEYSNTEELRVNWAKVLEWLLLPDRCPIPAYDFPLLSGLNTFESFLRAYQDALAFYTRLGMKATDLLDAAYGAAWPAPCLSATMNACLRTGRDITQGAAKYSFSTVNGCGMADVVDSLSAIRELVFRQHAATLAEVAGWMADGGAYPFAGRSFPRFGNGDPEADALMKTLTDAFVSVVRERVNPFHAHYQAGLYTVSGHASLGAKTGALPSGRPAGVSLANALSPCQGADKNGPTAVIRSVTGTDCTTLGNGMVLDMKFTPAFLENQTHRDGVRDLILTYFHLGGMEIQLNVVDRETLLDAQRNPAQYPDLIVRVSGFSAYFVSLDKVLQDEIIARTAQC